MGRGYNKDNKLFHSWDFDKRNYMLFGIGLLVILFGYILMASGDTDSFQSTKLSPTILLIGYIMIIPISILYRFKK